MPTLRWVSRDDDLKRAAAAPYRLLEAVPELGAGDPASGNMLIQGDNLDALKALLPHYAGRVKCIYIDPPYSLAVGTAGARALFAQARRRTANQDFSTGGGGARARSPLCVAG